MSNWTKVAVHLNVQQLIVKHKKNMYFCDFNNVALTEHTQEDFCIMYVR